MSVKHNFEAWYPELPDLLFGQVMGVDVFNATKFIELRGVDTSMVNVENYKTTDIVTIREYSKRLGLNDPEQMFLVDDNGDVMIRAHLAFSFVSYVDPQFSIYMHDRIHELFYNGVIVSDSYLAATAKNRLPKSVLQQLAS